MSIHNIHFCEELTKIIFQLSSDTHFICSTVNVKGLALAAWLGSGIR